MRKKLIITAVLASVMVMCFAQKPHKIMFYNMENFFDTIDDPETNDEEFLPDGAKRWNTAKYDKKLRNMERVLFDIAAIDRNYPAVIGVSEIENRSILEDIASTRKLLPARYAICHYDSPDLRGVDVAFLYRPDVFKLEGSADIPVRIASLPNWRTRGIVTMWGTIDDEPFLFMVAHWPSRLGGQAASAFKRNAAAEQMRAIADSVLKVNPATKIVAMGDFNDDPTDESVEVHLGAKDKIKELQPGDFYTPFVRYGGGEYRCPRPGARLRGGCDVCIDESACLQVRLRGGEVPRRGDLPAEHHQEHFDGAGGVFHDRHAPHVGREQLVVGRGVRHEGQPAVQPRGLPDLQGPLVCGESVRVSRGSHFVKLKMQKR